MNDWDAGDWWCAATIAVVAVVLAWQMAGWVLGVS